VPEGDTIHSAAARLRRAFGDDAHALFEAPRLPEPNPQPGERMTIVARGKHLLISFSGGLTLHTHLGMDGWWRVERAPGRAVPRAGAPGKGPLARVATASASAVVGGAPTVELLDATALRRHPVLCELGPDLCEEHPDMDEVVRRLGLLDPATAVGVALLDQRVASGIGNVFRSEVLWAERIAPRAPIGTLDEDARRRLYATASRLLRANIGDRPRRTISTGLAVYERGGRRCPRCRATIRHERLGEQARSVWWCPSCQAT
jgi:endonuclease-8